MRYVASNSKFFFKNNEFQYCINSHNTRGALTERVVEIPLLDFYLRNITNPNPIEIGCVSPYYWDTIHTIYDLTDNHPSCKNINAKDINLVKQNIVSISTIEHFNMDNYDIESEQYIDPIEYLKKIVSLSSKYLITFPLGYNPHLTEYILSQSDFSVSFLARDNHGWTETKKQNLTQEQLTYNTHIWYGNSIAIIENIF
jgi:hypothetical protein